MMEQLGRAAFVKELNVSRETLARFDIWQKLLEKWSKKINLVAPGTLQGFWTRHALDSAQLAALVPDSAKLGLDLGSGAGFPGLAIAIMRMQTVPIHMHLVESNAKKAAFLRVCAQETNAPITVICERIEAVPPKAYDVITARALAPLPKLLQLSDPFADEKTLRLFPKGAEVQKEIDASRRNWTLEVQSIPSITESRATILEIRKASRV